MCRIWRSDIAAGAEMLKRGYQLLKQLWSSDPPGILLPLAFGAVTAALISAEARFRIPGLPLLAIGMAGSCSYLMKLADDCAQKAQRTGSDNPLDVQRGLIMVIGLLFMLVTGVTAVTAYVALSLWEDRLWLTVGLAAASVTLFGALSWVAANSKWDNPKTR